jgi:hypothetical protein
MGVLDLFGVTFEVDVGLRALHGSHGAPYFVFIESCRDARFRFERLEIVIAACVSKCMVSRFWHDSAAVEMALQQAGLSGVCVPSIL